MRNAQETRDVVREKYGALAETGTSCCGGGSTCSGSTLAEIGYTDEQAAAIPEGSNLGLGCGNPLAWAAVQPGETVLDLGSGAGIDAFLASREVGPKGRVIGVDMTPAMLERARANAKNAKVANVEFRMGEIEHLPVPDRSVDVIISNCVINLSPEKDQVFREAYRALKPGGRLVVSDLVWLAEPTPDVRESLEALVGCVGGALRKDDYLAHIRAAGFQNVEVVDQSGYGAAESCCGSSSPDLIASIKVRGQKP
jgi:arsenite methyltransferase